MLSVLITWLIMAVCIMVIGRAAVVMLYDDGLLSDSYDIIFITGILVISVYAQIFSLFHGLYLWAFIGLLLIVFGAILLLKKKRRFFETLADDLKHIEKKYILIMSLGVIGVALWTSITPQHYDTYLYHAQAIHWLEDYGVVPGLGNLHFRLAYNSAFMPLQALFSFKWLFGQSLHTMNGLFTVAMMAFAVLKSDNNEKSVLRLSDLLKLGAFLYIFYDGFHVSSPNTDTMALILGYYILIKWAEYAEDDNCDIRKYAYLCVLLVYTATLKLSVGILVMLVVFPAYYLIDHKEWKAIFKHISLGIIVICPFLIRNVIISGYWLYPYEATKVGNFDWTMSKTVLQGDRAEIVAWGRGNQDITRNGEHIWQWIGEWYLSIHLVWKVMIIISLISLIYILIHALQKRERIFTPSGWLVCVCIIGPLFWLLTAPLPRYGIIYMIMLPCIALAKLMDDRPKLEKIGITAKRDISRLHFVLIGIYIVAFTAYMMYTDVKIPGAFMQGDYDNREVIIDSTLGVDIATPVNGDQTGYEQFPSAPYKGIISGLELRGEDLSEGFKLR